MTLGDLDRATQLVGAELVTATGDQMAVDARELSPSGQETRRDAVILIAVALAAALIPAWHSVRIKILDAIWN